MWGNCFNGINSELLPARFLCSDSADYILHKVWNDLETVVTTDTFTSAPSSYEFRFQFHGGT